MRATSQELETLWELQRLLLQQRKLLADARELAKGEQLDSLRDELSGLSEKLSAARLENEELRREVKRQESDLELVDKRIATDTERLQASSNPKDIAGIQSELESLRRRKSDLEDVELELMERLEVSDAEMHSVEVEREQKEQEIGLTKEKLELQLAGLKSQNQQLTSEVTSLRSSVREELLAVFEQKFVKGLAVGRLTGSTCLACNMSLNSTAMSEVGAVAPDDLASCPECGAMLVRS